MGCNCGKNLAANNPGPLSPDSDLYPFTLEGTPEPEPVRLVPGHDEQGNLVPFILDKKIGCSPVNPSGRCQFDGKKLENYGPYDYPAWML